MTRRSRRGGLRGEVVTAVVLSILLLSLRRPLPLQLTPLRRSTLGERRPTLTRTVASGSDYFAAVDVGLKERGRNRPEFKELLEHIRTGRIDCVIAYKTDRLSRGGGPGWAPLLEAFEQAGRDLDRAVATPGGWVSEFEIGIWATMDREESKKTSERMTAVRAREAR